MLFRSWIVLQAGALKPDRPIGDIAAQWMIECISRYTGEPEANPIGFPHRSWSVGLSLASIHEMIAGLDKYHVAIEEVYELIEKDGTKDFGTEAFNNRSWNDLPGLNERFWAVYTAGVQLAEVAERALAGYRECVASGRIALSYNEFIEQESTKKEQPTIGDRQLLKTTLSFRLGQINLASFQDALDQMTSDGVRSSSGGVVTIQHILGFIHDTTALYSGSVVKDPGVTDYQMDKALRQLTGRHGALLVAVEEIAGPTESELRDFAEVAKKLESPVLALRDCVGTCLAMLEDTGDGNAVSSRATLVVPAVTTLH